MVTTLLTRAEGLCRRNSHRLCLQTVLVELGFVQTTHRPQFSVLRQPVQTPQRFLLVLLTEVLTGDVADVVVGVVGGGRLGEVGVSAEWNGERTLGDLRGEQGVGS